MRNQSKTWANRLALPCWGSILSALLGCSGDPVAPRGPDVASDFVHVEGGRVVDAEGATLWLRGVVMTGWPSASADPRADQHDERDFERVAAMGMNVVRLVLYFPQLEDESALGTPKDSMVSWIDDNVVWAKNHGIYLVLSVYGHPDTEEECDHPFWDEAELQDRQASVWRVLAERYADEKQIAGFAPVDLPMPTQSLDQWNTVATRMMTVVREVDPNHMLFVGRTHAIGCVYDLDAEQTFPRLPDDNVLYEFDRQQPWDYVAQLLDQYGLPEYGPYPDDTNITVNLAPDGPATWLHGSWDSHPGADSLYVEDGDSDWTLKQFYYTVTDEQFRIGTLNLQSDFNSGKIYFDDIVVKELDENYQLVRTIHDLDLEGTGSWYLWQGNSDEETGGPGVLGVAPEGHRGKASVTLEGTATLANLSDQNLAFSVRLGHTYEVSAWVKGENSSPTGASMVRLDFWDYEGDFGAFDRQSIADRFENFAAWGQKERVPLNVLSYGTGIPTFEDDRGGLEYVNDVIDEMLQRKFHFTYFAYHSPEFGIYGNASGLPDPDAVNLSLVELLTAKHH